MRLGYAVTNLPVTKKLAGTPEQRRVARIAAAPPSSPPPSKVRATTLSVVGSTPSTVAGRVTGVDGEAGGVGLDVGVVVLGAVDVGAAGFVDFVDAEGSGHAVVADDVGPVGPVAPVVEELGPAEAV
jgi:hypothetical protein